MPRSWYDSDAGALGREIDGWMAAAAGECQAVAENRRVAAVIAPHAGYSYSGPTAAYAYAALLKQVRPKRVFLLGPSHYKYMEDTCALTAASRYATPVGDLVVDADVRASLAATGAFGSMDMDTDETEHSLELHCPYIARALAHVDGGVTLVPVLVGSLSVAAEARYGAIFAPYLDDPDNVFVISSDFCHWGSRFSYQYVPRGWKDESRIYEAIETLDREGMRLIEAQDAAGFTAYLKDTGNTVCGRFPIGVLLQALKHASQRYGVVFTRYAQSGPVTHRSKSSVSYASALVTTTAQ